VLQNCVHKSTDTTSCTSEQQMQENLLNFCAKKSVWHSEVPKQIWRNALAFCVKKSMWQEEVSKQTWDNALAIFVS
jgi:hypothetical protein